MPRTGESAPGPALHQRGKDLLLRARAAGRAAHRVAGARRKLLQLLLRRRGARRGAWRRGRLLLLLEAAIGRWQARLHRGPRRRRRRRLRCGQAADQVRIGAQQEAVV